MIHLNFLLPLFTPTLNQAQRYKQTLSLKSVIVNLKEGVFGRRLYSQSETSDSEPEVRKSRSGSRRGSIKDRLGSLTPKKEIKTERNEKKRNELTGLTITLSQNANDKKKSEDSKKRKRSYETMESDSDVSEVSSAQSYRNQGRRGSKYSESESESVKSYGSNVTSSSATSGKFSALNCSFIFLAASSRISTSSAKISKDIANT